MRFKISGNVREKESGLGIGDLMIRAYDKDLLFDDLLGTAMTDGEGYFEIVYTEKDFRELFESKPDIYLSVYAPPWRLLIETTDTVRWGASEHEQYELTIAREMLGNLSPTRPDDEVEGGLSLLQDAVRIEKRHGFDVPKLPRFMTGGTPGAPAVPEQMQFVALPLGGDVVSVEVIPGDPVRLPGKVNPLPTQEPVPDIGTDPEQFGDGFSMENMDIAFTPPDPRYFEGKQPYPETLVELDGQEEIGAIQIAAVRIRPLQYDPAEKAFIFYPDLRYVVKFDKDKAERYAAKRDKKETRVGLNYAEQMNILLQQDLVVSAKDIFWPGILFYEEAPYVIITDNYSWPESIDRGDGTTRAPTLSERGPALSGDPVAELERLAEWKSSRGMRTRVVTVSDIVDGQFGDFTEGEFARDLQEVLRNFVKHIHKQWDTLYLLLAGDVNVVPMRRLAGSITYKTAGCAQHTDNPPPEKKCHFVSGKGVVKLYPLFEPVSTDPLSTLHGGLRIPFDRQAGSGRLGWYYTSEGDFTTRDEGFTRLPDGQRSRFIIVEGPEPVIDDDYYWLRSVNSIPSDFYYASLVGSGYSIPGKHDFDANNNGLYGQYHWDTAAGREKTLDAVDFWSDVWVGRASVQSGDQARAFVDKVLTYERLVSPDGETDVDTTYLQKILYASAYWGRLWHYPQADTTTPPAEGRFTHVAGTNLARIHSKFDITLTGGVPSYNLVARSGSTNIVVPYNTAANASNPGWYFTTDDSYNTKSVTPTRFLKAVGPEADIDADSYLMDPVGLELAAAQKENLRILMDSAYPNFNSVERHYSDYYDLSPPPPLVPLEAATVHAALDNGVHFASLSGHGSPDGCCGVSSGHDFTNTNEYFIMFGNSCSTARPDGYDSLAEKSTYDPDGGAVAYVGNTRYGWIGTGDNYEEFFWSKLRIWGRAGPAAGLRLATGGVRQLWTFYTQTLFGDPEMPVWTETPSTHEVTHPLTVLWGDTINVTVRKLGNPVAGHRVTLMGGWTDSSRKPGVLMTKTTNAFGQASFELPPSGAAPGGLKITVTKTNFKPYIGTIALS
jgi:hypothetical protein